MKLQDILETTTPVAKIRENLREAGELAKRSDTKKEIETFISNWKGPRERNLVSDFMEELLDSLSGGI